MTKKVAHEKFHPELFITMDDDGSLNVTTTATEAIDNAIYSRTDDKFDEEVEVATYRLVEVRRFRRRIEEVR